MAGGVVERASEGAGRRGLQEGEQAWGRAERMTERVDQDGRPAPEWWAEVLRRRVV